MKIIHTGDWHIGKIVNEFSMIEDQKFVLDKLTNIVEEERPDAIIIAGDLYDRSIPPVEAVELLDSVFSKILLDLKIPILAIAGNHDSAERLSFASKILTRNGLHIAGVFDKDVKKVSLRDGEEKVNFYLLPYADPKEIRHAIGDDEISTHDDAMKKIIEKIKTNMNSDEKNVLVAHGYVTFMGEEVMAGETVERNKRAGLETSESERPLSIGGTDLISGEYFDCFNYVALGHLHGAQRVGSDRIRYSGSLLKYSFSEIKHNKGITIVNIDGNGDISIEFKELIPKRDMRIIRGPLEELINPEVYKDTNVDDYVFAILTDEGELLDPISKLRAVYPNVMGLKIENSIEKEESRTSASEGHRDKSKLELFQEFYKSISGKELDEDRYKIITEVIQEVEGKVI